MAGIVRERSRITAKGQTTVPKSVRQALGVSYGGEIAYAIDERGVSLSRIEAEEADPVIEAFLDFLARDMVRRPETIAAFPEGLADRMAALTQAVDVDLEEEIDGPVSL